MNSGDIQLAQLFHICTSLCKWMARNGYGGDDDDVNAIFGINEFREINAL